MQMVELVGVPSSRSDYIHSLLSDLLCCGDRCGGAVVFTGCRGCMGCSCGEHVSDLCRLICLAAGVLERQDSRMLQVHECGSGVYLQYLLSGLVYCWGL